MMMICKRITNTATEIKSSRPLFRTQTLKFPTTKKKNIKTLSKIIKIINRIMKSMTYSIFIRKEVLPNKKKNT